MTLPTQNTARTATSIRSLPSRSPSRPSIGVETAVLMRNTEMTQAVWSAVAPRVRWIAGRAGTTFIRIVE